MLATLSPRARIIVLLALLVVLFVCSACFGPEAACSIDPC
jgi:hypothetical protein